jgi:hypothetical protein
VCMKEIALGGWCHILVTVNRSIASCGIQKRREIDVPSGTVATTAEGRMADGGIRVKWSTDRNNGRLSGPLWQCLSITRVT